MTVDVDSVDHFGATTGCNYKMIGRYSCSLHDLVASDLNRFRIDKMCDSLQKGNATVRISPLFSHSR